MNKGVFKNIAIILLLSVAIFSMFKYLNELKARCKLQDSLFKAQDEIVVLTQEKQNLLQELGKEKGLNEQLTSRNSSLKKYLKASKNRISRLFRDSSKVCASLEDTRTKFSILKAENWVLIEQRKRAYVENEQFKAKLSSVIELKKAIRELRSRKRKVPAPVAGGNRGFLIRDGQPTTQEKVKIEVVPAQTKE
jgi:regulator of replication initiation timing